MSYYYYPDYQIKEDIVSLDKRFTNFQDFIVLIIIPLLFILFILCYLVVLKLRIKQKYIKSNMKLLMQSRLNQGTLCV
jgi:hypothetical protein